MSQNWKSVIELAAANGMKPHTLYARMNRYGYSMEEALKIPIHGKKSILHPRKRYKPRRHPCSECGELMRVAGPKPYLCSNCRTKMCEQCNCQFVRRGPNRPNRFCTVKCQAEFQKTLIGDRARNWQGGIDKKNRASRAAQRNRKDNNKWRLAVLKRDNFTCQKCGHAGQKKRPHGVHAHHIKPFKSFPDLRTDLSNGVTLCRPCHVDAHRVTANIKNKFRCHKLGSK